MPNADPFLDCELSEVVWDVVIRFHEHDQYGSERKAISALRRRVPGYTPEVYEKVFNANLKLLRITIEIARPTRLAWISPGSPDYDREEHVRVLDEIQRGVADTYADHPPTLNVGSFIGWVHFWHHLK